jgi:hypothetical protein
MLHPDLSRPAIESHSPPHPANTVEKTERLDSNCVKGENQISGGWLLLSSPLQWKRPLKDRDDMSEWWIWDLLQRGKLLCARGEGWRNNQLKKRSTTTMIARGKKWPKWTAAGWADGRIDAESHRGVLILRIWGDNGRVTSDEGRRATGKDGKQRRTQQSTCHNLRWGGWIRSAGKRRALQRWSGALGARGDCRRETWCDMKWWIKITLNHHRRLVW